MTTVISSVAAMRSWLRFTGGLVGLLALYAVYLGATELIGSGSLPPWAGLLILVLAASSFVPALLIWRQAEAATRYLNEPTPARLLELTSAMRRFWRLSGAIAVLQLTVLAAGAGLHSGW